MLNSWRKNFDPHAQFPQKEKEYITRSLKSCEEKCSEMGLNASVATIRKMLKVIGRDGPKREELWKFAKELHERIYDEMDQNLFLSMTLKEADHYRNPLRGWGDAPEKFRTKAVLK